MQSLHQPSTNKTCCSSYRYDHFTSLQKHS